MKIATLLAIVLAYLLLTDWIADPWSSNAAYAAIFSIAAVSAATQLHTSSQKNSGQVKAWIMVPMTAAAVWGLLQLTASIPAYRFDTWSAVLKWTAALALFWTALQAFRTSNSQPVFRNAIVIFGALLSLEAVLLMAAGSNRVYGLFAVEDQMHPMGSFANRDHFCALMELILPIALWSGLRTPRRAWVYFTAAGAMYASVIVSASKAGAIVASFEVAAVLIVSVLSKKEKRKGATAAAAAIIIVAGAVVGWSPLLERFAARDLFLYRREFFASTIQMIRDHPLLGTGLGSWSWVYPSYALIDVEAVANHAHSDWLEWAADGGVPFVAFIAMIAIRSLWLSWERPWGFGVFAVFAHAAVDFPLQRPPLLFALFFVLALLESQKPRSTATAQ